MPNRPTERGKSLLLQKEMNQKHCNAKTSTLNGSALSTKCRKYEKVIGRPNVISLQHTVRDSWAQRTRSESTERRRDPFIKRKRGEPQEQVTETQSEGKTRFYPTHSHEFRGQTGKRNTNRRRDGSGKQKLATDAQPPYRERQVTSASERDESETLQCKNFHAQRQRALNKMPQIRKGDWKTKCNFVTAYGERQLGPTHKERID